MPETLASASTGRPFRVTEVRRGRELRLRSVIIGAGTLAGIYILFQTIFKVILW